MPSNHFIVTELLKPGDNSSDQYIISLYLIAFEKYFFLFFRIATTVCYIHNYTILWHYIIYCVFLNWDRSDISIDFTYICDDITKIVCCNLKPLSQFHFCKSRKIHDSERSDECIDFTMMCVFFFFVSVDNIWSSKNASIFDFSPSLKKKLNLVGTLGSQKKNPKKMREKRDFIRKTSLRQNRIFYFAITQKLIDCLKFEFIRNMSKLRKFARSIERKDLKFICLMHAKP
ncbi:hypothetical protein AGLY_013090 [Aphis glycines]|uniref:Uncharacterized protein n=1 Tax=Aphis glycines TaxID=307491 RepID=A0A6G0T9T7_APHGL|nr:hypothetical protein AGLY_013090 [Aphis glycines]